MLSKLEMLLALAKEQHFGRAAESLGITQPTLSSGIRQLEEQLSVQLVQRSSRYGGLTPEGQRALIWARQIVGDARRLRDEMRNPGKGLSGHIRLAAIPTALTWVAQLTGLFTDRHPNVSFTILSRSSTDILGMLDNLDIDAGISYLDNEPLGRVHSAPLYKEEFVLVCKSTEGIAKRSNTTWQEIATLRLCLLTPDMQNRRIINRNFLDNGVEPHALIESNSTIILVKHVTDGGYATILPRETAEFLAAGHDLAILPITNSSLCPSVGIITQHQEPFTPVVQALFKTAAEIARS